MVEDGDVERVVEYVHGQLPADWAQWPGGWPTSAFHAVDPEQHGGQRRTDLTNPRGTTT